jgi:hypothetical protein
MAKAKLRKQRISAEEFSGASIAALVVTVGYNVGPTTWPGRICIWSSPLLVLLLPILFAAMINWADARITESQYKKHHRSLRKMIDKASDDGHRAYLETQLHATEKAQAQRLRKLAASPYEDQDDE